MPETGTRADPFFAFRFELVFDDLVVGGFSEIDGLELETEVHSYAEGGQNTFVHKFPGRTKQSNLRLKHGVADRAIHDWYLDMARNGVVRLRDATILVWDPSGAAVVMEWDLRQAFPCKWTGPALNATQSAVAVESVELCHRGLERRV